MKKVVSILIISLLVTSGFVLFINLEPRIIATGETLYVGGSGPGNWTNVQDAIDNATNGDTVFVFNGVYLLYTCISLNKKIKLIGEDKEKTIIDASDASDVILHY